MTNLSTSSQVSSVFGVRSMTAPLARVAVRPPSPVGDYHHAHWAQPLDFDALAREHAAFVELLRSLGCSVDVLAPADGQPDAIFTYDPCFVTARGVIELRAAKPARAGEPPLLAADLDALGLPVIGRLSGAATADGGDMFWIDERTLAVGRTYRTNEAAVAQLRDILAQEDAAIETFDMPHDLGPDWCLHLMSVVSPVRDDLAVVYEQLAPVPLLQALAARGIELVSVPQEDYLTLGCNVLTIEPGVVVMAQGNDATARALRDHGVKVHEYDSVEIAKGEGGPTCLTRPISRS